MSTVRLIGMTQPVEGIGCSTADELVAFAARVSNPSNQLNHGSSDKLLAYLVKHQHWSPFEMVHATLEIKTTRDIARQILRHRSFSFQEFSQRYADPTKDLGFELREARLQDPKNRQNSVDVGETQLDKQWREQQQYLLDQTKLTYKWAIENGIAKEQARAVLPEGNTCSTMYMAGSLRSWIHYCDLRMGNGTQKEHMVVARQCWDVIQANFPSLTNLTGETK